MATLGVHTPQSNSGVIGDLLAVLPLVFYTDLSEKLCISLKKEVINIICIKIYSLYSEL